MCSDDDQPIVMSIVAGFNSRDELTVTVDFHDYEVSGNCCSTAAVVNSDDARAMARRHKVAFYYLPLFIAECMEGWHSIVNSDFNQVRDCFKEITECLLDEGCRLRIVRTYGQGGFSCC